MISAAVWISSEEAKVFKFKAEGVDIHLMQASHLTHAAEAEGMNHTKKGLTLIEILITLGILTIITGLAITAFKKFREERSLDTTATQVKSMLNRARQQTFSAKNNAVFGVRLNTGAAYLYQNTFSTSTAVQIISFDPYVRISSMNLKNATNTILFSRLTGETMATGTIVISLVSSSTRSRTLTVYQSGLVD